MDFVFQGFQPALPVWLYFCLIPAALGLAWWSYRDIQSISPLYRYSLMALRGTVFVLLFVLMLNPFFRSEQTYFEKPELLVMMDNSSSTAVKKGDYSGEEAYRSVLDRLNLNDSSRVSFRFSSFDRDVKSTSPDSLSFAGNETNLYNAVEVIKNSEQDIAAAVLISDGIFNQGRNPVFESATLEIPVFTIAVGDTSLQKDLLVKSVVTNSTGYVGTRHPVEVTVINNGINEGTFSVRLMRGSEMVDSRTLDAGSGASTYTLDFELQPEQEGLQQYRVIIPALSEEWTTENNSQPFAVDVLDEKQRILSLAFEVYPDVRYLRSLLLADENTRLIKRTWLGNSRFLEGQLNIGPDSLDLIVLHGYPSGGLGSSLKGTVVNLLREVPSIVIATPLSYFRELDLTEGFSLPVRFPPTPQYDEVVPQPSVEPTSHPVMELPGVAYNRLPALNAPIRGTEVTAGANMLFENSFQGRNTGRPLIAVEETGNLRKSMITGYGWYRLGQSSNTQIRDFTEQLFYNIVSWTATRPDNRRLRVEPAQKVFTGGESVVLNAFLTNERGEKETEAVIEVTISGSDMENRFYSMNNEGNGQYRLELGSLPEGVYSFEAVARKGSREIDRQNGEFSVSGTNIEFVNTVRNDRLMQQIADRTGGTFFLYNSLDDFWEVLNEKGMLKQEEEVATNLFYPYQHSFWFILVVLLLAAEWIVRKLVALP